ncbi:hypothetical protein [Angustibacter aerolatus]
MTNTVVDLEALQAVSARLLAAADAARDLSRHPGVVRGRAADGGDDALRDAAVHFADRWSWALDRASYDARRIGELLGAAVDTYRRTERLVGADLGALRDAGRAR